MTYKKLKNIIEKMKICGFNVEDITMLQVVKFYKEELRKYCK